jgi:transcriptional regulator with XRE-family HTH domain
MEVCVSVDLTFGAWLRLRRRQLDLTQKELADRSSCSVVTIRKIEQGNRRPSKQLAELMAAALQVPAEQMADFVTYARQDPDSTQMPIALQGLARLLLQPPPSTRTVQTARTRPTEEARIVALPRPTTPFLGREAEIEALLDTIQDPDQQLVSILGPGGMGKTRLALAVADRLAASDDHPFRRHRLCLPGRADRGGRDRAGDR